MADVQIVSARFETVLRGLSAYEIAVRNGYAGTEAEWLVSLQGGGALKLYVREFTIGQALYWTLPHTPNGIFQLNILDTRVMPPNALVIDTSVPGFPTFSLASDIDRTQYVGGMLIYSW